MAGFFSNRMKMGIRKTTATGQPDDGAAKKLVRAGAQCILQLPPRPLLSPRALPNGVQNSPTVQRVSVDVVLQASDVTTLSIGTNIDYVRINKPLNYVGYSNSNEISGNYLFLPAVNGDGSFLDSASQIYKIARLSTIQLAFIIPKGTYSDLSQAQAALAGTVIRYQLAAPIDLNNVPFGAVLEDKASRVGKNLFDIMNANVLHIFNENRLLRRPDGIRSYANRVINYGPRFEIKLHPNTQYTLRFNVLFGGGATNFYGQVKDFAGNVHLTLSGTSVLSGTFVTSADGIVRVEFARTGGAAGDTLDSWVDCFNIQLELGPAATAYEPYRKNNALLKNFAGTPASGYDNVPVKGAGDAITYANLVSNGDYESGLNNWTVNAGTIAISSDFAKYGSKSAKASNTVAGQASKYQDIVIPNGKRIYIANSYKITAASPGYTQLLVYNYGSYATQRLDVRTTTVSDWTISSGIITVAEGGIRFYDVIASYNGIMTAYSDGAIVINLTDNPAVVALEAKLGRPLTVAECDYLFAFTPTSATINVNTFRALKFDGTDDILIQK